MSSSSDPARLAGVPAAQPAYFFIPNHVNPHSSGPVLIGVGSVLLGIMLSFVGIRIYTKSKIVKKFSPDDCGPPLLPLESRH